MLRKRMWIVGLGCFLQFSAAFGETAPYSDLHDPEANKLRADVSWGGLQCAVNTAVLVMTGGTVAAALTPDMSALLFQLVREEIEADPASFTLPAPVGHLADAFNRLVQKISQNPGIVSQTAMVTLLAQSGGPGGMLKLFTDIAVIRVLAECGINIYKGVVQLSKDIPALVVDIQNAQAAAAAVRKVCADHTGWTRCNRTCWSTNEAIDKWMPRCERGSEAYQAGRAQVLVAANNYCYERFCHGKKDKWQRVTKFSQCRLLAEDDVTLESLRANSCR